MSDVSKVPWADASWSFLAGCTQVSAGCAHCWARTLAWRKAHNPALPDRPAYQKVVQKRLAGGVAWTGEVGILEDRLLWPLRWRKGRRVSVALESDLFHPAVPDWVIYRAWSIMRAAPQHRYIVLAKRPERMSRLLWTLTWQHAPAGSPFPYQALADPGGDPVGVLPHRVRPLPHVAVGITAENQEWLEKRLPWLLKTPAALRWISFEPLLGEVDLRGSLRRILANGKPANEVLHWVVVGGESAGTSERALVEKCPDCAQFGRNPQCERCGGTRWAPKPEALEWLRRLRDDCSALEVPLWFKQFGGPRTHSGGDLLGGAVYHELPEGLQL